jgi:hypothetical protein
LDEDTSYTTKFDEINYQQPPNLKEMEKIYRKGCEFMMQFGYCGKGCGKKEQCIWVLIEPNVQETKICLGFHPLEIKQSTKRPSLNINTVMFNFDNLTLKYPELIDPSCEESLE